MKLKYIYTLLLTFTWGACDNEWKGAEILTPTEEGVFLVTQSGKYTASLTRSASTPMECTAKGNMGVSINEKAWEGISVYVRTVSGDDTQWYDGGPFISLYVTDASNNDELKISNIPFDGHKQKVYDYFSAAYNNKYSGGEQECKKTVFLWDTWNQKANMPTSANFYGYFPRPTDTQKINQLFHQPLSIINLSDASNKNTGWHQLRYEFESQQADETMFQHDLMYSGPENTNGTNHTHWGNKNKTRGDNIQMHFTHAFSLLNITIHQGTHKGPETGASIVSGIEISGNKVYTKGTLDILRGEITTDISSAPGSFKRKVDNGRLTPAAPFQTNILVQPCTLSAEGDLIFLCKVDDIEYKCDITGLDLKPNTQYDLNLTLAPDGFAVFRLWKGAILKVDGGETISDQTKEHLITTSESKEWFTVTAANGYTLQKVLKNGTEIHAIEGKYPLSTPDGTNDYYNVVVTPIVPGSTNGWYIQDCLRMHFDGMKNNIYYDDQQTDQNFWHDLSGNDNHGALGSFTNSSGWNKETRGLVFDGEDDIVTFPGGINSNGYTISIILYTASGPEQKKVHYRLIAEGNREVPSYPSYYIYTWDIDDPSRGQLGIYSHGLDEIMGVEATGGGPWYPLGKYKQFDFIYDGKYVQCAINGSIQYMGKREGKIEIKQGVTSVDVASIGNRITDTTRALKGTYYGVLIYDKALSHEEIRENWNVTSKRYSEINFNI